MLKTLGSFLIVEEMRRGKHPQKAAEEVIRRLRKYPKDAADNQIGYVVLDKRGRHGAYSLHPGFNYAIFQRDENIVKEAGSLFLK